ncbi:MAG: putative metal-dependent hydrolase [Saprospiraceae bacterium]|nr:putative metal-dependent hydrolase [Saprospiraceae bacterium]
MNKQELEPFRFPVGRFDIPETITEEMIGDYISVIAHFPTAIAAEVAGLSDSQLSWRYRPDGWSIRQVVHHCADSHMNAYIRFKLALTEVDPQIKPYEEALWAMLPDTIDCAVEASLDILRGLHKRWAVLLVNLGPEEHNRGFFHPGANYTYRLDQTMALYAWHCKHHLEHIKLAKAEKGRFGVV